MVSLPGGLNEATIISALAIVIGVVAYSFLGGMLPTFSYSQYLYPILGVAIVAVGVHIDHAFGDVAIGAGAALAGATIKGLLPS